MTPGKAWLAEQRTEAAAEKILQAAERLFADRGPAGVGMAEIADAAGCSRATLYRYFPNRRALQAAFAQREALRIVAHVGTAVGRGGDPGRRLTDAVLLTLEEVRSRPTLRAWTTPESMPELLAVLRDAPLVEALVGGSAGTAGAPVGRDRVHWFLRCLVSLLALPAEDRAEERRLVEQFVVPLLTGHGA